MKLLKFMKACYLMRRLHREGHEVSVFFDKGWGDSPLEISIILDGEGNDPKAIIERHTYEKLLAAGVVGENVLQTFKCRKNHIYNAHWEVK